MVSLVQVVSIVVLGPSSENEQRHLLKLFLEKGFTKNGDRFAGYHHFFDSDGSPGKLIRYVDVRCSRVAVWLTS